MLLQFIDFDIFLNENIDLIKMLTMNVVSFIVFLIAQNIFFKNLLIRVENIERNTNIMKHDFRTIKYEYEGTKESLLESKKKEETNNTIKKMLYENPTKIKNEFIIIKKHSIELSPLGVEIGSALGLKKMIENNWNKFLPYINDVKENYASHPYDLQLYCIYLGSCIEHFFSKSEVESIKLYSYKEGNLISVYFSIIGVLIKNKFFSENIKSI